MFSLELECRPEEKDLLIAELWEHGSAGMVEIDDRHVRAFFEDGADVSRFHALSRREEPERDWVEYARAMWRPMAIGERFFLVPEWIDVPTPAGRLRIAIDPGQAFGTGVHETTQLCLEALERHLHPGDTVLDVGAGTGILAQAALLLGAGRAYACDTDPLAVEAAQRTLSNVFTGSATAVRGAAADIVVANISPEANTALAPELLRCVRPGGRLILSGLEAHEAATVEAAFAGTERRDLLQRNTWVAIVLALT